MRGAPIAVGAAVTVTLMCVIDVFSGDPYAISIVGAAVGVVVSAFYGALLYRRLAHRNTF